jgi:hypothetical protein
MGGNIILKKISSKCKSLQELAESVVSLKFDLNISFRHCFTWLKADTLISDKQSSGPKHKFQGRYLKSQGFYFDTVTELSIVVQTLVNIDSSVEKTRSLYRCTMFHLLRLVQA